MAVSNQETMQEEIIILSIDLQMLIIWYMIFQLKKASKFCLQQSGYYKSRALFRSSSYLNW